MSSPSESSDLRPSSSDRHAARRGDEQGNDELSWKERSEALLHATGQVVYERDPVGNEMVLIGDVERLLGYTAAELSGGWSRWLEIVHPEDRHLLKQIPGTLAPGTPFHVDYRVICKDGTISSLRDDGCLIAPRKNARKRMVGALLDISGQRELAHQLQHAQKMEVFGRLAGGVAHDFNNLLTVFSGYTDLLITDFSSHDPRREYLEEMQRASERASALTSQLLAFGRLQRSSPRLVNLGDILLDLRKMLRRLIGEDIELVVNIAQGGGMVSVDPRQMETVLINLVVNARDAMPHGGRLSIDLSNVNHRPTDRRVLAGWKPGPYVQLAVSDTGIGIDPSLCSKIFEPFFTTKAPGQGTGLGLSTCYGIVEQSGGRIEVESVPGRGSTFQIFLPRAKEKAPATAANRGQGRAGGGVPRGKGETILLVEDDFAVQKIYGTMLRRLGYNVICGSNGDEALRLAGQHPEISLAITDLVMPLMSGTDFAQELRHVSPDIKILLTSGYASEPVENFGSTGPMPFLPKPLSRDILACTLRELLETA